MDINKLHSSYSNENNLYKEIQSCIFAKNSEGVKQLIYSYPVGHVGLIGSAMSLFIEERVAETSHHIYHYREVLSRSEELISGLFFKVIQSMRFQYPQVLFELDVLASIIVNFNVANIQIAEENKRKFNEFIEAFFSYNNFLNQSGSTDAAIQSNMLLGFIMDRLQHWMSINGKEGIGYLFLRSIAYDNLMALEKLTRHPHFERIESKGSLSEFESIGFFEILKCIIYAPQLHLNSKVHLLQKVAQKIPYYLDFEPKNGSSYFNLLIQGSDHSIEVFNELLKIDQIKNIFIRSWNQAQPPRHEPLFYFESRSNDLKVWRLVGDLMLFIGYHQFILNQLNALKERLSMKQIKKEKLDAEFSQHVASIEAHTKTKIDEMSAKDVNMGDILDITHPFDIELNKLYQEDSVQELHQKMQQKIQKLHQRHQKKSNKITQLQRLILKKETHLKTLDHNKAHDLGALLAIFSSCRLLRGSVDHETIYKVQSLVLEKGPVGSLYFPFFTIPKRSAFFSFKL